MTSGSTARVWQDLTLWYASRYGFLRREKDHLDLLASQHYSSYISLIVVCLPILIVPGTGRLQYAS